MYKPQTRKKELYFDEVIRLHYEKGYGEDRISAISPVGHSTVNRWIRIFAAGKETGKGVMPETKIKEKKKFSELAESETVTRAEYEKLKAKLETAYPFEALTMALRRIEGLQVIPIHHSDRGCQYASHEYVGRLKDRGISISMTECGDPKDNAQTERVNNTMKNELLRRRHGLARSPGAGGATGRRR